MPSVLLTNVNRLINKLDELAILCASLEPSLIAITETWLTSEITDDFISLSKYHIFRRDRSLRQGGGVLLYIRDDIQCKRLTQVDSDAFEVLWVALRPKILPRPLCSVIVCVVYCPPWFSSENKKLLAKYIVGSVDKLNRSLTNSAVIICGDFNTLDTYLFNKYLLLHQVVYGPTGKRSNRILDKIFINCNKYYSVPANILAPLGKSDHNCVFLRPLSSKDIPKVGWRSVSKRNINDHIISDIGYKLASTDWRPLYYMNDVQRQTDYFYCQINTVLDTVAPVCESRFKNNDKPWITTYFKRVVTQRNHAYSIGNHALYRKLRNKANRLRINLKKDFYFKQTDSFKNKNPSKWWKTIKILSGCSYVNNSHHVFDNVHYDGNPVNAAALADVINNVFVSFSADVPCLDIRVLDKMRDNLDEIPDEFLVSEYSVYNALSKLKINKALGPDGLPNKLLKSCADVLAAPVCAIINTSIRCGVVPTQWKLSRVSPLPKIIPPVNIETDLRPISITSPLAKIAESFLCKHFNSYFSSHLDNNQFGCIASRSTLLALIKLSHYLFTTLDNRDNFGRIVFVDFTKAFDLINHNVLLDKMYDISLPPHLVVWFLSFLSDRSQYVSVGSSCSGIQITNAGTPQGTLSGPADFTLLINDLTFDVEYIKYVDDTTATSVSDDPLDDSLQLAVDVLHCWCQRNGMRINTGKTKEMLIYFGSKYPLTAVPKLNINGTATERVNTYKLLGVFFNNNLTWHDHVIYIVSKACKRIHCIAQLVKSGVKNSDVVSIYCSIIRSILEYCCPVWHPGITLQESSDIERVQKRCLKIIFPDVSYNTALVLTGLERLSTRRERIVREAFNEIKNPNHVLNHLLVSRDNSKNIRSNYQYVIPKTRTLRCRHDFITYCLFKRY